LGNFLERN